MMLRSGLVSVSFRQLSPSEVVALCVEAGLEGIEWGGDVHVPPGDVEAAEQVGRMTREAGLANAAYGSYYRMAESDPAEFAAVLEAAAALRTPIVRVWAGKKGSDEADDAYRQRVVDDSRRIATMAAEAGVTLACEWHGKTLTDETASSVAYLDAVDHPAFLTYWQPHTNTSCEDCLKDMDAALPRLIGLHVYEWDQQTRERLPLAEGESKWLAYFERARQRPDQPTGPDMFALLEFVADDEPANLLRDAATLKAWLAQANQAS